MVSPTPLRPQQIADEIAGRSSEGGPPHNDGMEHRVTALETRLDTTLPTLATKVDLADLRTEMHKGFADMVKWIVGVAIAGVAIMLSVLTFYVNTGQRAVAPAQVQPIVIQLGGAATLDGVGASGGLTAPRQAAPRDQATK